jgi:hypothetical protein
VPPPLTSISPSWRSTPGRLATLKSTWLPSKVQIDRAARLSEDLTAYMREREPQFSDVDFADLVAQALDASPAPQGISVSVDATATIHVDPLFMLPVLTNVITNACQAVPEGRKVNLFAERDSTTRIVVKDTGQGSGPAVADSLFDPFISTKQQGTGLGLTIVQRRRRRPRWDGALRCLVKDEEGRPIHPPVCYRAEPSDSTSVSNGACGADPTYSPTAVHDHGDMQVTPVEHARTARGRGGDLGPAPAVPLLDEGSSGAYGADPRPLVEAGPRPRRPCWRADSGAPARSFSSLWDS